MVRSTIIVIILLAFLSCNRGDEAMPELEKWDDCFGQRNSGSVCDERLSGRDDICEIIFLGEDTLTSKSISYVTTSCLSAGDTIVYRNESNDVIKFTVGKDYSFTSAIYLQRNSCGNNNEKNKAYCRHTEVFTQRLTSVNKDLCFGILLIPQSLSLPEGERVDKLTVTQGENSGSKVGGLSFVTDARNVNEPLDTTQLIYPEIDLNGTVYGDVFSNEMNRYTKGYKVYYNREVGLIGFMDNDSIIWTIDQ